MTCIAAPVDLALRVEVLQPLQCALEDGCYLVLVELSVLCEKRLGKWWSVDRLSAKAHDVGHRSRTAVLHHNLHRTMSALLENGLQQLSINSTKGWIVGRPKDRTA